MQPFDKRVQLHRFQLRVLVQVVTHEGRAPEQGIRLAGCERVQPEASHLHEGAADDGAGSRVHR